MFQMPMSSPMMTTMFGFFCCAEAGEPASPFIRSVFAGLRRAAAREGIADGQCGAITAIQRFGSALNVNVRS